MNLEKFSRRGFLAAAAAVAGGSVLAACGSAQPSAPTEAPKPAAPASAPTQTSAAAAPTTAPALAPTQAPAAAAPTAAAKAAAAAPVQIAYWTNEYTPLIDYMNKKVAAYKQVAPNVTIQYLPLQVADLEQKLRTTLAAGAGNPDLFNAADVHYSLLMDRGWVAPYPAEAFGKTSSKDVIGLFHDAAIKGLTKDDQLYGIPIEWNALSLYYNRKHFAEAGLDPDKPPKDWLTLSDMAVKLTKRDSTGNLQRMGFQVNYGASEWPYKTLNPMIEQLGGHVLSPDLKEAWINRPEAVEAIQLYTDHSVKYKVAQPGFQQAMAQDLATTGLMSMWRNGPYAPGNFKLSNPNFKYKEDWDIARFPQWPEGKNKATLSHLWRYQIYLAAPSKNQVEAAKWAYFIVSDYQGIHQNVGFVPSIKGWENASYVKDMPWIETQLQDLAVAVPIPPNVHYQEIAQQVLEMLERIEGGRQKVQESADEAAKKINVILKS